MAGISGKIGTLLPQRIASTQRALVTTFFLLLEDGSHMLLEDGGRIVLE